MNALRQIDAAPARALRGAVVAILMLLASFALAAPAGADTPAPGDLGPSVWSDKADYGPGETVTLSGASWQPGEAVHIRVNDDAGSTWSRDVDVTADDAGAIADSFELPGWFVAQYSVTATGASGSTAKASFTDANLKVAGTFVGSTTDTYTLSYKRWSAAGCNGNPRAGDPLTATVGTTEVNVPQSSEVSVTLTAAATSAGGRPFVNWKDGSGAVISTNATVCLDFPASGTEKGYTANYGAAAPVNAAPAVAADNPAVSVNEGQTAGNTGTYSDANGDAVSVTASRGTITKAGTSSGTWSWSLGTTDGPDQTGPVTITANDGKGGVTTTSFTLNVANVAPTVTLAASNPTSVDEGATQRTYSYTISDPGADTVASVATSCGANGLKVTDSDTNTNSAGSFKCTFADGRATSIVSATATDSDDAAGNLATQSVTIDNVAPALTAPADQAADEGASKSFDLGSFTDPGPDAPWAVDVDWGDGSAHTTFDASSTGALGSKPHTYADGPATRTVTVKVTDTNGDADSRTFSVRVANVAPTVTLSSANDTTANEGTAHTYSYSIFDPGQDTVQSVATSCGDDGVKVPGSESHTDGSGSFECRFPDGPASSTVSARATDSDGDEGAANTQTVRVANVAPTVTLSGAGAVSEGSTHTYSFTVTDPGQDGFVASTGYPDCDAGATDNGSVVAGSYSPTASGGTFECSFPDGPATANVKMQVFDEDGAGGTDSEAVRVVEVANVTPKLTAPAGQSAAEGATASIDLGSFTDPGPDAPWAVDVDWGDGSAHTTFDASDAGSLGSKTHSYADGPDTRTVTVTVTDKNGASDTTTFSVAVANVAPKVTLASTNDLSVDEGTTHTYSYSIADPGQDTVQSVDVGCGDRGSLVPGSSTNDDTSGSFRCSFPDGLSPATATTVSAAASDSDGDTGARESQPVTVKNVAPTVTPPADQSAGEGSSQSFSLGSFGDPGADSPWKATVSWGDGATTALADQTSTGSLGSAAHTYADNGTYTVGVTVTDKDGGKDTRSFKVAVANAAPKITRFSGTDYIAGPNAFLDGSSALKSTLTTEFTDPGADTWTGLFSYTDGNPLTETVGSLKSGDTRTHAFASVGCKTATVKVTDDDGGSDTASTPVKVSSGGFQPPMTNQPVTDKLKNGQVLPVKVRISDCTGAGVATLTPAIRLVKGDLTPQSDDAAVAITPTSSSSADTAGVMRSQGGGDYIYNMQVNLAALNTDHTVVIYPYGTGSPSTLGHVIQATK